MALNQQVEWNHGVGNGSPGSRRGACPTLASPMRTGDGLLVRLRPAGGVFSVEQFRQLALAAQRSGNGILEITARGSVQVRGLAAGTVGTLSADINAAGISVPVGPAVELSPLHGVDPDAFGDAFAMEQRIREGLASQLLSPALAPKLSIIVDAGGQFGLSDVKADIRVMAISPTLWIVAANGDESSAVRVAAGSAEDAVAAVGQLLHLLLELGVHKRGRDLDRELLARMFPKMSDVESRQPPRRTGPFVGSHGFGGRFVIGLRPRFGQLQADSLIEFLAFAEELGAAEVRPAPWRSFFLTGLEWSAASKIAKMAPRYGLSADPDDPSANLATCAGAGACASGHYSTKSLAAAISASVRELLDGSMTVHLSGCAKGCAHPQPALTISGASDGYDVIIDGLASDQPDAHIAGGDIDSAIQKLARLIKNERHAGESPAACLRRLDRGGVARALQQE